MECFRLLLNHVASIKHQFLSGIRDSREAESLRDDEKCGRSKEDRTAELIGHIKNVMDKDRRVSVGTISAKFDVSVRTVHTIIREELKMRKICVKFVPRVLREDQKEDFVMTAGRCSSWSLQIPQFLMLWWLAMKAGSTAMTKRPRDRVPSRTLLALPDPRRPDRANPPQTFDDPFFFDSTSWIYMYWVSLDRQSTRNTILRF